MSWDVQLKLLRIFGTRPRPRMVSTPNLATPLILSQFNEWRATRLAHQLIMSVSSGVPCTHSPWNASCGSRLSYTNISLHMGVPVSLHMHMCISRGTAAQTQGTRWQSVQKGSPRKHAPNVASNQAAAEDRW